MNLDQLHSSLMPNKDMKKIIQENQRLLKENETLRMKITSFSSQMQEMKSVVQEQSSKLQKQSGIIKSLNERIGRLAESDLILKENEKLKGEIEDRRKEVETTAIRYKKELDHLDEMLKARQAKLDRLQKTIETKIENEAERKAEDKVTDIQEKAERYEEYCRDRFMITLLYSIVFTFLFLFKDSQFLEDLIHGIRWAIGLLNYMAQQTSSFLFETTHLFPVTVILSLLAIIAVLLGIFVYCPVFYGLRGIGILVLSLAIVMPLGEEINAMIGINLLLVQLLVIWLLFWALSRLEKS